MKRSNLDTQRKVIYILLKLFEKLIILRLLPILEDNQLIPKHQFDFRKSHGTTEQVHRVV